MFEAQFLHQQPQHALKQQQQQMQEGGVAGADAGAAVQWTSFVPAARHQSIFPAAGGLHLIGT